MSAHPLQDVHQVGVGVDAVHLARHYQTLEDTDVFGTNFRPAEQPILSAHWNDTKSALQPVMPTPGLCRVNTSGLTGEVTVTPFFTLFVFHRAA
jgi:hypothetical protein